MSQVLLNGEAQKNSNECSIGIHSSQVLAKKLMVQCKLVVCDCFQSVRQTRRESIRKKRNSFVVAMQMQPKITDLIAQHRDGRPFFSLEFFPPKTDSGLVNLYRRFDRFALLHPLWIDCTWGAGGGTSEKTLEICDHAATCHGLVPMMHITCTNMSEELLQKSLASCKEKGIRNLLALRGDPPADAKDWKPGEGKFQHAIDLVKYIKEKYQDYFCIGVAGYPEGHLECIDLEDDLRRLKEKVDAGGSLVITQIFFDVTQFKTFLQRCRAIGITVPILPGILPIQSYAGFIRFTTFCRTKVPQEILNHLETIKDDENEVKEFGIQLCIKMCKELLTLGVPGLHFYTLNLDASVVRIIEGLDILGQGNTHFLQPMPSGGTVEASKS